MPKEKSKSYWLKQWITWNANSTTDGKVIFCQACSKEVFIHSHRRSRSDDTSSPEALSLKSDEVKPKPTFAQQQAAMRRLSAPVTRRIVSKIKMDTSNEEMEPVDKKVNEKDDSAADIMYGDDDIEFSDLAASGRHQQPANRTQIMAARKKELEKEYISFMESKSRLGVKASKDIGSPDNLRNMNKRSATENIDEIYKKENFRESMQHMPPKQTRYTTSTKQLQAEKNEIKNKGVRRREMNRKNVSLLEGTTENICNELRTGLESRLDNVSSLSLRSWRNAMEYGKFSESITPLVQLLKSKIEMLKDKREKSRRQIYDEEDRESGASTAWPSCSRSSFFNELSDPDTSDYSIQEK